MPRNVAIEPLNAERADSAFTMVCEEFARGSVIHAALGISEAEYRDYLRPEFYANVEAGLSLAAVDWCSGEIQGCLIARDFVSSAVSQKPVPDRLLPMMALLHELEARSEDRCSEPGRDLLVDMAVVSRHSGGLGIYKRLREASQQIGRRHGFVRVIGELSSAATQHVCVHRMGHQVRAEVDYASFEYRGQKPFAHITEPAGVQLVVGEL